MENKIIEYMDTNIYFDIKYWSNSLGELYSDRKEIINETDLPKPLFDAFLRLWKDGTGSLCRLIEYKGEFGIALINEFDECFAEDLDEDMDYLYKWMQNKAKEFIKLDEFSTSKIILGKNTGFENSHEFIVFLPTDTTEELFEKIIHLLLNKIYPKL